MNKFKKRIRIILSLALVVATLCGNVSADAAFQTGSSEKDGVTVKSFTISSGYNIIYKYSGQISMTLKNNLYVYVEGYYYSGIGVLSRTKREAQKESVSSLSVEAKVPSDGTAICDSTFPCMARGKVVGSNTETVVKYPN